MKRDLERIEIPGEYDARRRTWNVVRAAFEERERVAWPRRHGRALALAAAAVAVVAAAVTPPGRSVVGSIRDAVGREKVVGVRNAQAELLRLPASGRLLVQSRRGAWVVQRDGSRRLLGHYRDASWSPHGLYVAAIRDRHELVALDPAGNIRWVRPHRAVLRSPRWSYEGYRIAYFAGRTLRVIVGNGSGDRAVGPADPTVPPAWRPGTHEVAYVDRGAIRVVDVDSGDRLPPRRADRTRLGTVVGPGGTPAARVETRRGRSTLVVGSREVFSGVGRLTSVAWSPNGRWLAVAWPAADQLVFVRVRGKPTLVAVSSIRRQFGRSADVVGWAPDDDS